MEISFGPGAVSILWAKATINGQILVRMLKKSESITICKMQLDCQAGDRRFRNYGAGKLKQAMDLELDKVAGSKYSWNLGGFVQQRGKVTTIWRRNTMGLMPLSWGEVWPGSYMVACVTPWVSAPRGVFFAKDRNVWTANPIIIIS